MTQERLREVLNYDPETGVFIWLKRLSIRCIVGRQAGCKSKRKGKPSYVLIRIDGVLYSAHVLAVLYMTGKWPADETDHKNLQRYDNRWDNLREVTHAQNLKNQNPRGSASGFSGVFLISSGRYRVQRRLNGKARHLGCFDSAELAGEFSALAVAMMHPHCPENRDVHPDLLPKDHLPTLHELCGRVRK